MEDPFEQSMEPSIPRAEGSAIQPGGRVRLAGFAIGLLYGAVVIWLSGLWVASLSQGQGYWLMDMAPGLSLPMVPQFGLGLAAGLLVLLLLIVLLRRSQRDVSIGLLPGAAVLALLLIGFLISVPSSGFRLPMPSGGPMPLTTQEKAALQKANALDLSAQAACTKGNWAMAAADYRAEIRVNPPVAPSSPWISLGLMLDRQGKPQEAYTAYRKGFYPASRGLAMAASPEMTEAVARFGIMCEERGRRAEACECYSAALRGTGSGSNGVLPDSLPVETPSSAMVRSMLYITLGLALEGENSTPQMKNSISTPTALAAFHEAVHLESGDPRPWYFLADGLRRDGQFGEAQSALQQVSRLDTNGHLKAQATQSMAEVHNHSRE